MGYSTKNLLWRKIMKIKEIVVWGGLVPFGAAVTLYVFGPSELPNMLTRVAVVGGAILLGYVSGLGKWMKKKGAQMFEVEELAKSVVSMASGRRQGLLSRFGLGRRLNDEDFDQKLQWVQYFQPEQQLTILLRQDQNQGGLTTLDTLVREARQPDGAAVSQSVKKFIAPLLGHGDKPDTPMHRILSLERIADAAQMLSLDLCKIIAEYEAGNVITVVKSETRTWLYQVFTEQERVKAAKEEAKHRRVVARTDATTEGRLIEPPLRPEVPESRVESRENKGEHFKTA
jgi:hypothetical protein